MIIVLAEAQADIDDTAEFIAQDNPETARRFVEASYTTFQQLAESPSIGTTRDFHNSHLSGLRSWRIRGFENWLVFYRPITDGAEIIRVLHGARDLDDLFEVSE